MIKSAPALQIELGSSRYLHLFVMVTHCGAILAVGFTAIDLLFRGLMACVVLLSLYRNWCRLTPKFPLLRWDSLGQWWLSDREGREYPANLLPGSYVHPWLIILRFRVISSIHDLVLTPDNVSPKLSRRLRVRLKQDE